MRVLKHTIYYILFFSSMILCNLKNLYHNGCNLITEVTLLMSLNPNCHSLISDALMYSIFRFPSMSNDL